MHFRSTIIFAWVASCLWHAPLALAAEDAVQQASASAEAAESAQTASPSNPFGSPSAEQIAAPAAPQLVTDSTPPQPADLWERIRNGFALQELDSPLVREHEAWYANRPDYMRRMIERSQRYLFHIVEEVEKRGMPTEIALLPMIESAYNPKAYSRSRASGIWQFVPSTGKNFGLEQNSWYDGRRDILAATDAALDYLQKLHDMFGSWELALAAYNWGEGSVSRAIARNQAKGLPTDYLSLRMPPETRNYVPKLIAVKNVVINPPAYGLELSSIPNQPYFGMVAASRRMDLSVAARLAEIPLDELTALNPAYNRPLIAGGKSHTLLLPVDKLDSFTANLANHPGALASWQFYPARRGEKLDGIARKFGITAARLKAINGIPSRKKVAAGQTLLVPLGKHDSASDLIIAKAPEIAAEEPAARNSKRVHIVARGETLLGIAKRYSVSAAQLKAWNHLKSNRLALGQKLAVSGEGSGKRATVAKNSAEPGKRTQYTVRRGDTISSIARRFKVAVNDIHRWNGFSGKRALTPGNKVTLYLARRS